MNKFLERKIKYNTEIVEYHCKLLQAKEKQVTLFHLIDEPFTMNAGQSELTIEKGSYTLAYYWKDRPYNLYYWRNCKGEFAGAYFNIVRNTIIHSTMVSFEDLIIDVLVLPSGDYYILDEDELPVSIDSFEEGSVDAALKMLLSSLTQVLFEAEEEASRTYTHEALSSYFNLY